MSIDVSRLSIDELKNLRGRIDGLLEASSDSGDELQAAVAQMAELKAKVASVGKAAVAKAISAFLAKHPEAESIRFRLYTPYFNDGDECKFRIGDVFAKLVGATGEEGDYEDGYQGGWDIEYECKHDKKPVPEWLESFKADLSALHSMFRQSEDAMKATFGNHVIVTIGRDGKAEVEEYEHD